MRIERRTGQGCKSPHLHQKEINVEKELQGYTMKNPLVQEVSKWMLRAYMVWSICADVFLLGGVVYLIFF